MIRGLILVLAAMGFASGTCSADELPKNAVDVGNSRDASDKSNIVTFSVAGGREAQVKAGETKAFELHDVQREITWYSLQPDGKKVRERCANDSLFNWVKIERAGNGAITWTFYRAK